MTISNQTARTSAVGTATAGQEIPFSFPITDTSEITVKAVVTATGAATTLTETTHYSVTINGDSGGTVTLVAAWAATYTIFIVRTTDLTQTLDLTHGGTFSAERIEDALDRTTKLAINVNEKAGRALTAPDTDPTVVDMTLPSAVDRADKYLMFGSDGSPSVTSAAGSGVAGGDWDVDAVRFNGVPWYDVTHADYGATGDGTTDDTVAVQAAATAAGSGIVFFPAGTYKITADVTLPEGQTWLGVGENSGSSLSVSSTAGAEILLQDRCRLRNLRIVGDGGGRLIRNVDGEGYVIIENCRIATCATGITFSNTFSCRVKDCWITACTTAGLSCDQTNGAADVVTRIMIDHVSFTASATGAVVQGVATDYVDDVTFSHCNFSTCTTTGIAASRVSHLVIEKCHFEQNAEDFTGTVKIEGLVIRDCWFNTGISATPGTYTAIDLSSGTYESPVIAGNRFYTSSTWNSETYPVNLGASVSDATVSGNHIGGDFTTVYNETTYTGAVNATGNKGRTNTIHSLNATFVTKPFIDVRAPAYGAKGDGVTNDTAAFNLAMTAAVSGGLGSTVYVPDGTYLVDPLKIWGARMTLRGQSLGRTILKSRTGDDVIEITALALNSIEIDHLTIDGNSGAGHGIYVHDNTIDVARMYLHDLYIHDCGGRGIYLLSDFTTRIASVDVHDCGDNAIEFEGGNSCMLENCYVHDVAAGKAAYRQLSGFCTYIACNGITGGTNADWAVIGSSTATGDATNEIARATFIGCNMEDYTHRAVYCKYSSAAFYWDCSIVAPATGTVVALEYETYPNSAYMPMFVGCSVTSKGAVYENSEAVHAGGVPFVQIGTSVTSYYTGAASQTIPTMTPDYYGAVNKNWWNLGSGLRVDGPGLFEGPVTVKNGVTGPGYVRLYEDRSYGEHYVDIVPPSGLTADYTAKSGTLVLDDGANWRVTLVFEAGVLVTVTTAATSAATATWTADTAGTTTTTTTTTSSTTSTTSSSSSTASTASTASSTSTSTSTSSTSSTTSTTTTAAP